MPIPKTTPESLGWIRVIGFKVNSAYFDQFSGMTSLSDIAKTLDSTDGLELWKDTDGNYHWATCATLTKDEIAKGKRVFLTSNQVLFIPPVKAEFNDWKKSKNEEPPKKLCGFHTPLCVLASLEKPKKPRAPATPKKSKEEKEFDDAKEVAAGKKKKPVAADIRPAAVLSKQTAVALAGMDIDDAGADVDVGKELTFQPMDGPSCVELDTTKEFTAHLQVLQLMHIFENQDTEDSKMVECINEFVGGYRQSEHGTAKKTLAKWCKTTDPDFKNLLAGFGLSVLAVYKNKVVTPFVATANDKLKEVVTLYQELQAKIKSSQVFVNQLKADKERLADDLQSLLAKNRALETELEEKRSEVISLYKQLEERKNQEEKDEKKKRDEELAAVVKDPLQTVISSSGSFRKRDEPSPPRKKKAALVDSDDEMVIASGKVAAKPAKKRAIDDDEEGERKPAPKKSAVSALADTDDDDDAFAKPPAKSAAAIVKSMNLDDDDDDDDVFAKPAAKPAGAPPKAKPNANKFLLGDDDD